MTNQEKPKKREPGFEDNGKWEARDRRQVNSQEWVPVHSYEAEFHPLQDYEYRKKLNKDKPEFSRRIRLDLMTPAELTIYNAMQEIEKMGADIRLTDAQILLSQARDKVADFVDGVESKKYKSFIDFIGDIHPDPDSLYALSFEKAAPQIERLVQDYLLIPTAPRIIRESPQKEERKPLLDASQFRYGDRINHFLVNILRQLNKDEAVELMNAIAERYLSKEPLEGVWDKNDPPYADGQSKKVESIAPKEEQPELLETLKQVERICDNLNPTHENIWRLVYGVIKKYEPDYIVRP